MQNSKSKGTSTAIELTFQQISRTGEKKKLIPNKAYDLPENPADQSHARWTERVRLLISV